MSSPSQLTANRENAQHSTGPKSAEGKARVAQNRTTHGLSGHSALIPGEDPAAFQSLVMQLQIELAPATAVEEALVATIVVSQWRTQRIANWVSGLTAEALTADPALPSRLMKMFSKSGDPSEALARLHRLEGANLRQWHNALRELRLSKETRNRAATGQNPTAYSDIVSTVERARAFCESNGLPPKPLDDSNPIPSGAVPVLPAVLGPNDLPEPLTDVTESGIVPSNPAPPVQ